MSAARRERKVVTVVFCDLVGFTSKAESMDPEDVEAILRPYHERVRSELERHGGTVEKFIGDAVMALFGAPTAHEDDPERAVRAALAIREFALEEGLELRVGITTGEALVSLDADPAAGEGMASGDVVNTAARLQSGAPINGILVDDTTHRATRHIVDFDEPQTIEAKGKSTAIAVRRVLEVRARFGVDVAHEARSELVGRERELAVVQDAFDRARHARTPQLVTLVGVPGIGKSRLVYELQRIVEADPDLITWRQGRCLAYGDGVTLWALAEIVKAQAGIAEQDADKDVAAKLSRTASDLLPEADATWVESHLLALVGLAAETELGGNRRNEAFSAWRRLLEGMAEQRPLVLVFEDLHWADDALLDFVDELVDWLTDVPLLVVATARPELLERRPAWGGGKLNATTLALAPLSDDETVRLLAAVLASPVLEADSQLALIERAGGNPLYAEQFAELYAERGSADELSLPETLQGIIAARLDGLGSDEKALMQDAAVVGKVFWTAALGRDETSTTPTFHSLERKGFVRRQRRSSVEGQTELAFAHALVRDVAYGQIPRADRATKHRRVAEWIESLGRSEDHAEMRAYHWRSALDLARASGADDAELTERARLSLRDAGDRAAGLNTHSAAASLYEDALGLWPEDNGERPELLFRRARALHDAYDERAELALAEARDALLTAGDRSFAGEAEAYLADVAWHRGGQDDDVRAHFSRALDLVDDDRSVSAARVLTRWSRILIISDDVAAGLPLAEQALALSRELRLEELQAHALTSVGMAKNEVDLGSGTADMERGLALALEIDSPIAATILNNLAVDASSVADLPRADELWAEAELLADRFGDRAMARFLRGNRVWIDMMRGRWDQSLEKADAFIAECEAGSPHLQESNVRGSRAAIREARGDPVAALEDLHRAHDLESAPGASGHFLAATLAIRATTFAAAGRIDDARADADALSAAVRRYGADGSLLRFALVSDELGATDSIREAIREGERPLAERWQAALDQAYSGDFAAVAELASMIGMPFIEARYRQRAGERLLAQGSTDEGEAEIERALTTLRSLGAARYVAEIEDRRAGSQRDSA